MTAYPTNPEGCGSFRGTAEPDQARKALIRWYAERAQDWLNANGPEIIQYKGKTDLALRASTRLRNALVAYRPRQELVLSWAAAQLTRSNLHTLVIDALGLAVTGNLNRLRRACRHLSFGDIRPRRGQLGQTDTRRLPGTEKYAAPEWQCVGSENRAKPDSCGFVGTPSRQVVAPGSMRDHRGRSGDNGTHGDTPGTECSRANRSSGDRSGTSGPE